MCLRDRCSFLHFLPREDQTKPHPPQVTSFDSNAEVVFRAVGDVAFVDEELLDVVTALSGSGPAYVYQKIARSVRDAVDRAAQRSRELADELSRTGEP